MAQASYRTTRAVIYYLYSEHITFTPLSSSTSPNGVDESRTNMIQSHIREKPTYPAPVSAKSVYVLASRYDLPALRVCPPTLDSAPTTYLSPLSWNKELALAHFKKQLTKENILTELFSTFCRLYDRPRYAAIYFASENWAYLKGTVEWRETVKKAVTNR